MNKEKLERFIEGLKTNKDFHYETKQVFIELAEALLEEPKAVDEPVKNVKWRAEKGKEYLLIADHGGGDFRYENGSLADDYHYLTGNYYKTEQEAEQALEVIKAKGRLVHSHYALTNNFLPNKDFFESSIELKNQGGIDWVSPFYNYILNDGDIYYLCVIDKWFENKNQFDQFIKENESDLKLVFNIQDSND